MHRARRASQHTPRVTKNEPREEAAARALLLHGLQREIVSAVQEAAEASLRGAALCERWSQLDPHEKAAILAWGRVSP